MARQRFRYLSDYDAAGNRLVAVCRSCQRASPLNLKGLIRVKGPMLTLPELALSLRCRNCGKKNAEIRVVNQLPRPRPTTH